MLVCRGLNGLRYVFVVVNLVALSPGVRKQSKPPPISNAKCRGQRNTSKRSQNEISPWEHVLQWGRRSVVKWYHMFGSWVCLSHVPTCKFNNILHKLIQSATAPPFQNHQKPKEEAKQATTRAKKHVRPCWNPFTRSEFICLLIVTVGIPRRNCKTHTQTYKHNAEHRRTNISFGVRCWICCFLLNNVHNLYFGISATPVGAANWSCPHPFPPRHCSRCSVACIPAARWCHGWSSCCPLDTTHLDPWVKRLSPAATPVFSQGCCRCCSPSIPCINMYKSTPSLSALVALRNVKTRLSRQANVMSKWSDILRSLYSCGTCGPPLTFIYGSSTAVQATV